MPLELIKIGGWLIEINRAATEKAYLNEKPINVCTCSDCQNYYIACITGKAFSPASLAVFQSLGITPEKEAEVYTFYANQHKTQVYYGGFYHFLGRILEKPEKGHALLDAETNFEVDFTESYTPLSNRFPQPALAMNFTSFIPWVLDEKPDIDIIISQDKGE